MVRVLRWETHKKQAKVHTQSIPQSQEGQAEVQQKKTNVSPQVYRRTISRDEGAVTRVEQS